VTASVLPAGVLTAMYDRADREYDLYLTRQCERAAQARVWLEGLIMTASVLPQCIYNLSGGRCPYPDAGGYYCYAHKCMVPVTPAVLPPSVLAGAYDRPSPPSRMPVVVRGALACQWVALVGLSPRLPRVFRVYDRPSLVLRPALWSRWGQ